MPLCHNDDAVLVIPAFSSFFLKTKIFGYSLLVSKQSLNRPEGPFLRIVRL